MVRGLINITSIVLMITLSVSVCWAHFGMIIPSDDIISKEDKKKIVLQIQFAHPFEGELMNMEHPEAFGCLSRGKKFDLLNTLEKKAVRHLQIKRQKIGQRGRKIEIKQSGLKPIKPAPVPKQEVFEFMRPKSGFQLPSLNLLDTPEIKPVSTDHQNLRMQSRLLEKKLEDFGVRGKVVAVSPGPVITTFEYEPASGVKINKIVTLTDDLALALRAISIRIVAPIPGKAAVGIEIPNPVREMVAATSVGMVGGVPTLDLDYDLDFRADVDMNVVVTESGGIVELQGTAEGTPFSREDLDDLIDLALSGIRVLLAGQRQALVAGAGEAE